MKGAETALLVATCVALLIGVILLVLLARYYKQIRSYLLNCLPLLEKGQSNENKQDKNAMQKDRPFKKTRKHFSAKTLPTSAVRPRIDDTAKSGSHRRLPTLLLNEEHEFTVPMLSKHPVQPTLSGQYNASYSRQDVLPYRQHGHQLLSRQPATSMTDVSMLKNRSSAVSFALDSSPDNMYLRPALHRTMSTPLAALNLEQIQVYRRTPNFEAKKCISDAELTDNDSLQHFKFVQPELYQAIRRRTVGSGDLGKILCSLKYKDDTKRTLNLILHRVNGLQPFGAYVQGLYVNIIMLPDRESIYQTRRLLRVEANLTFEDSFDFSSKPLNRDFESKTIRFVIRSIAKDSKESNYGEARIPLLSYEIYSQIPTDVSLNIAPLQEQAEIGDMLIQLIYSPDPGTLSVTLKTLKFPSPTHLANITGIEIKSTLKRDRQRSTRKSSLSRPVLKARSISVSVEINDGWNFSISKEDFKKCTLKVSVKGKHRVLSRNLALGKILIGEKSCDEAGELHWQIINKSPGVAWTMWHPVYGS